MTPAMWVGVGVAAFIMLAVGTGKYLKRLGEDLERIAAAEKRERTKPPQH
jgi:hypothetical protein